MINGKENVLLSDGMEWFFFHENWAVTEMKPWI